MPPVAAIAVPLVMSATVAGVATGALVVGAGLTIASKITGSKLMGKIGMGLTMAGGIGGLAAGAAGVGSMTLGEIGGQAATGAIGMGETAASSVMSAEALGIGGAAESGAGALANTGKALGTLNKTKTAAEQASDAMPMFGGESDSMKRYDMAANILGGIAQGSDDEADRRQAMKLQDDRQAFEQKEINRRARNLSEFGGESGNVPGIRRSNAPLLRAPQPLAAIR
jgi:hypothetical protein